MVNIITANELKVKGVSALDKITSAQDETIISVRGKNKYIVLSIDEYRHLVLKTSPISMQDARSPKGSHNLWLLTFVYRNYLAVFKGDIAWQMEP